MKVGLVRHFRVKQEFPKGLFISVNQLTQWLSEYDVAEIDCEHEPLPHVNWTKCYASTSFRAMKTAEVLYKGEYIGTDALRELNVLPLLNTKLRMPLLLWGIIIQNTSLGSTRITDPFKTGMRAFLDEALLHDGDVLIVSHGFVMMHMQKELFARGFTGERFKTPLNGKLYVYEK